MRVFLAEDDVELRRLLASALRQDGHFVLEAKDGPGLLVELTHAFWRDQPDPDCRSVIISDVRMPGQDGLAILGSIRELDWCPPVILMTAFGDVTLHQRARLLGAHAVLDKPFAIERLRQLLAEIATQPPRVT